MKGFLLLGFVFLLLSSLAYADLGDNLSACYDMNKPLMNDFTEKNINATLNGAVTHITVGQKVGGGAFSLAGNDADFITLNGTTSVGMAYNFTQTFWLKIDDNGRASNIIGSGDSYSSSLRYNTGNAWYYFDEGLAGATGSSTTNNGVWYHMAIIKNGTEIKIFKDTTLIHTDTDVNPLTKTTNWDIGG